MCSNLKITHLKYQTRTPPTPDMDIEPKPILQVIWQHFKSAWVLRADWPVFLEQCWDLVALLGLLKHIQELQVQRREAGRGERGESHGRPLALQFD